jgi:hypothetical protein
MVEAIDISEIFIQKAIEEETNNPLNIHYQVASADVSISGHAVKSTDDCQDECAYFRSCRINKV